MSPQELSVVILAIAGVVLQLALKYLPKLKDWYDSQENKAGIALGLDAFVALAYFGLACVPVLAELLKIAVECTIQGAFVLLQAFWIIVMSQQATYLLTRKTK